MSEKGSPGSAGASSAPTNDVAASPNKSTDDPLLQSIKQIVSVTNSALASFEETTDESSAMFTSRLRTIGNQARHIATRAIAAYEIRSQYGPPIVVGSVAVVGGAVAYRTGKIRGALAGGLAGAAAYGGVYGFKDHPAISWRNKLPVKEPSWTQK